MSVKEKKSIVYGVAHFVEWKGRFFVIGMAEAEKK